MNKILKDVFKDFKNGNKILDCEIQEMNLYKKVNKLICLFTSNVPIEIEDFAKFEMYIKQKFKIEDVEIRVKYNCNLDYNLLSNWQQIVNYMAYMYPLTKAILFKSEPELNGNILNVKIFVKSGADILTIRKVNSVVENIVYNLTNTSVKVNFLDCVSEEIEHYSKERMQHLEEMAIREAEEQARIEAEHRAMERQREKEREKEFAVRTAQEGKTANNGTLNTSQTGENANIGTSNTSQAEGIAETHISAENMEMPNNMDFVPENQMENSTYVEPANVDKSKAIYGKPSLIFGHKMDIANITENSGEVLIEGELLSQEARDLRTGKVLITFLIYDGTSTISCKIFAKDGEKAKEISSKLKEAKAIKLKGEASYDQYARDLSIMCKAVIEGEPVKKETRMDNSEEKRVELHLHTQMSQMDAVTSATDLIKRAAKWGMKSIAITDHGVVQAFPEAKHAVEDIEKDGKNIKILYGVEAYLVPDKNPIVFNLFKKIEKKVSNGMTTTLVEEDKEKYAQDTPVISLDTEYCVLDIETTGVSFRTEKITEIAAVKIKNGEKVAEFSTFVNPEIPIPEHIVKITNITDEMVKDAETIDKVMPKFLEFIGNDVLVAHNAGFDIGFLRYNAENLGMKLENVYIDTLSLSRALFSEFKKHKLGIIAEKLGIQVDVAHRALDDVITLIKVFNVMIKRLKEMDVTTINQIDETCNKDIDVKKLHTYHAIILTQTQIGLKNLYKLISKSHLDYFYKKPRIPKSLYSEFSEGLIIGSACEAGELYRAIVEGKTEEEIEEIADFYDYLEIQPVANNNFMVRNGTVKDNDALRDINRKIVELGEKLNKLVVATCDVHFMDPEDEIYRRILQAGQGYEDADFELPLYLRTTEEMLQEFSYLGEEKAYEVVVTNTNKISDMCENVNPISDLKCPPEIEGSEKEIKRIAEDKARELYGDNLPDIVRQRMDKELDSIINNGFAVMYMIAQKLVWKSNSDGYLVGSRGSVGSSFVAYLTGITEVNSLQAHYRCKKCKYSDFTDYGYKNGFDLPNKECPVCGEMLAKDGMDIPFETFLGFNGDKEPDIDLNFSGEYQGKAHRYVDVLFPDGSTFKAGTIGTIADKTAFGYVKKYFEEREKKVTNAEIARLSVGCTGVKRTSGQHPGGIIVVPAGHEIYEFCPIQHPADDPNSDIITTHFDYHSIDKNLLKLDILGHDDPTMIRMLQDLTNVDPQGIPLDDKETMSIFSSTEALGVTPEQINSEVGTYGVPEFGTKFVRGMLVDTKPTTFDELIRISGLSHGTDVWLNNAQDLINEGTVTLADAICCRDDIMIYLMRQGLEPNPAFKIMEAVRKGKVAKGKEAKWEEYMQMMKEHDVPDWYIASCKKIKYMFPKAHAAAYVTMAFRIAWFKVHIPMAYYTAYYTVRADEFDSEQMIFGKEKVRTKMREIEEAGNSASKKDQGMYGVLEIVLEMYERGINFLPIDLYKSHATKFRMEEDGIRPPLNSIPGLGSVAAEGIYEAVQKGDFMCVEELRVNAGIGKSVVDLLRKFDCLSGLPESNQISLFG